MLNKTAHYINGEWITPEGRARRDVINPATGKPVAQISLGLKEDVDLAVKAARAAFDPWASRPLAERLGLLENLRGIYEARMEEMAQAISTEMGAPITLARDAQAPVGLSHLKSFIRLAKDYTFEAPLDARNPQERIIREPIGVCGLITPWNWPMNQVALKVFPALVTGCTIVLKPSEISPLSAMLLAEFIHEAGIPAGVFNLVNGEGAEVGEAISRHEAIDLVSFTGSYRAGVQVQKAAADTVKRVALELGGKSANIIFDDGQTEAAVKRGLRECFLNSGQGCNAPTRMLVERSAYPRAVELAAELAKTTAIANPADEGRHLGPLASGAQWSKVQSMIETALTEGATLAAGGPGRPEGLDPTLAEGFFVRPTVLSNVTPDMAIARDEVFGPVLVIMPFDTEEEAIAIANDSPYGLAAYVQSEDVARASRVARRLRAGMVQINGTRRPPHSPFGGYRQSGNGREGGAWGFEEFTEVKAVSGWPVAEA